MAKITNAGTNKQNRNAESPNRETPPAKKKYLLLDKSGIIVATLIDKTLAERWAADHKVGAVKFIERDIAPQIKEIAHEIPDFN